MKTAGISILSWLLLIGMPLAALGAEAAPVISMAAPAAKPRDLLSDAGENQFWIVHVGKGTEGIATQTTIVWRERWSGNADWKSMPPIIGRIVGIAMNHGELLLVLENGQWEITDGTDIRTGPTPPQGDDMIAIAGEQDAVWAVVRGMALAPVMSASTQAATIPTTEPSTQPGEPRLVACQFVEGKWIGGWPLPDGVGDDAAQMSLGVVRQLPILSWRTTDGQLNVSRLTPEHGWTRPVIVNTALGLVDFKLLTINDRALLWVASGAAATRPTTQPVDGAGEVLIGDDFSRRVGLQMPTTLPSGINSQTLVAAFGNLRWIAYAGGQQIEQDYSLDAFPESFPPAKMSVVATPKPPVIPIMPWVGGNAVLVIVAGLAGLRQRQLSWSVAPAMGREVKLRLAPVGARFVAGLVDLAPLLAVMAIVHPANAATPLAGIDHKSLQSLSELATLTYILHTLVAELICGQSIGKMIFNLQVVGPEGGPPTAAAILIRNLLRVVDVTLGLPLLLVVFSPLRQRVGDIAAGTVVIARDGDEGEDEQR